MPTIQDLREQLTDESIKDILIQYNVEPFEETEDFIVFPTCCHNLVGGSPKLYYYKNTHLFHCYTECAASFDIFELLIKMHKLRGEEITLKQSIALCNLDTSYMKDDDFAKYDISKDLRFLKITNNTTLVNSEDIQLKTYDREILRKFSFDYVGLQPWLQEGIGVEALQRFNIKYDSFRQAIIIPNFNIKGELIGIRGRFFKQEDIAKGKYRPIFDNGTIYNYPTGKTFYGIYENHKNIERKKMCVIFEGEKSVF